MFSSDVVNDTSFQENRFSARKFILSHINAYTDATVV
jgi:hypothetical protein